MHQVYPERVLFSILNMGTLFCYQFRNRRHETSGMPNFYNQVISLSGTLSPKSIPTKVDSLDTLVDKIVHNKFLTQHAVKSINNILNPLIVFLIVSSANSYSSLVFIGPVGFVFALMLRVLGYKDKISVILYDVSFVDRPRSLPLISRLKVFYLRQISKAFFSRSSKGQLLVLCSSHYERIMKYNPTLNIFWFKYGVYTPFYVKQRELLQELPFSLTDIHPLVKPFKYCLAIGSAYRNEDSLKLMAANSQEKDRVFLKISIDHCTPPRSVVQMARNLFYLYNFSPQEYLELLFYSSSALVLSANPTSMAGLTTVLECVAMKKQVFVHDACYGDDYTDKMYIKKLAISRPHQLLFNDTSGLHKYCDTQDIGQYHQYFIEPAKAMLELI